jgi:hypothetical protein
MKYIITNPEVIAIDQDPMGMAGDRVYNVSGAQVWVKNLFSGDLAVVLYNSNDVGLKTVFVTWDQVCALVVVVVMRLTVNSSAGATLIRLLFVICGSARTLATSQR